MENNKKIEEFSFTSRGNKLKSLEEYDIENDKDPLENLEKLLSLQRVVFRNKISQGIYEPQQNRVKLEVKHEMNNVGFFIDQIHYLRPYEALYFIEMGKLEVKYDSIVMSLDQAYEIFINSECSLSLEEYLVYQHLMRSGHILKIHNPHYSEINREKYSVKITKEQEIVWKILLEQLKLSNNEELLETDSELYNQTKLKMNAEFKKISGRDYDENSEPLFKKQKTNFNESDSSFLDVLKNEPEFFSHQEIFNKFNFIKRHCDDNEDSIEELKFNFDAFFNQKMDETPSYRILIIKSKNKFPSNLELSKLRRKQRIEVPVILAIVSESLSIHFCICNFE